VLLYDIPRRCLRVGNPTQDVRSLKENKLIQVQPAAQHDSGLAGLFESLISGVRYVGNFNSTYSSGLPIGM
jgi:hypothetical protein